MVIVKTKSFTKDVKQLRLTAGDLEALEDHLKLDPEAGDKIEGLRGVRKIRFGIPSRRIGKRGGGRAIYFIWTKEDTLVLLMAYGKSEKSDLTKDDRDAISEVIDTLLEEKNGEN